MCADYLSGLVATGDIEGSISVWEEAGGKWLRRASFRFGDTKCLVGLLWVSAGSPSSHACLCTLHEDGHLVTGTPDGLRVWSRDVRKPCSRFCIALNGTGFVLATQDGEILLYDSRGMYTRKLSLKGDATHAATVAGEQGRLLVW